MIYTGIASLGVVKASGVATLYAGGNDKQQQVASNVGATGTTVDSGSVPKLIRKLWIKTNNA